MAGRLGRQHGAFKVLSSIDQAILTRRDIDPVINIVIKRIQQMNSAEPAGVTILETSEIGKAKAYTFDQFLHQSDSSHDGTAGEIDQRHTKPCQ